MSRREAKKQRERVFIRAYGYAMMSRKEIAKYEWVCGESTIEMLRQSPQAWYVKSHKIDYMSLEELRKWKENRDTLLPAERRGYAHVNHCCYEMFERDVLDYLEYHEEKQSSSWQGQNKT